MPKPTKKHKQKITVSPKLGSAQIRRINDLIDEDEFAEAVDLARESARRFPAVPDFYELEVTALMSLKEKKRALRPVRKLLDLNPDRVKSLYLAALVYGDNGDIVHTMRC